MFKTVARTNYVTPRQRIPTLTINSHPHKSSATVTFTRGQVSLQTAYTLSNVNKSQRRYYAGPVHVHSDKNSISTPPANQEYYKKDLKGYNDISSRTTSYLLVGTYSFVGAMAAKNVITALLGTLSASADVLALSKVEVNLATIPEGKNVVLKWQGKPIFIRHRTADEIAEANAVSLSDLRHQEADSDRVKNPEWLVMVGICTHLGCVPVGEAGEFGGWFCPCHGSHYDISGRVRKGPAPLNMEIPPYELNEADNLLIIGGTTQFDYSNAVNPAKYDSENSLAVKSQMSNIQIQLCKSIISEQFGPIIMVDVLNQDITVQLTSCGRQTLRQLTKAMDLPSKTIKEALITMIQHNIVTFAITAEKGRRFTYYEVCIQNVMLRLRYSEYIRQTYAAAKIIQVILENGRLQPRDIVELSGLQESQTMIAIESLQNHKFIYEVSELDQGTLSDKYLVEEQEEIAKSSIPLSAVEMKKLKTRMAVERNKEIAEGPGNQKRKYVVDYDEIEAKKAIIDAAIRRLDPIAGEIVKLFLSQVEGFMRVVKEATSAPLSLHNFGVIVAQNNLDFAVDGQISNPLKEYIDRLSEDQDPIFNRLDMMAGGKYVLELSKVSIQIKSKILSDLVIEEFGMIARRVWGVLLNRIHKYDDKQVSKFALLGEKTTREQLYNLFKLGLVFMQDVPRNKDHSASKTFFLYYTDINKSCELIIQRCYKTINRLEVRKEFEIQKRRLLIEKASRDDIVGGENSLSEMETSKIKELDHVLMQLDTQVEQIDLMVMALRDF